MSRVFIVGVGRSGTSLLQSIIASHPDVVAIPETGFLRRFMYMKGGDSADLHNDKNLRRCPKLLEELKSVEGKHTNSQLLDAYKRFTVTSNQKTVLDKDPRLIECIPQILKDFPEAKILNIYRDPRDVIASKKRASWSEGRSILNYLVSSRVQLSDAKKADEMGWQYSLKYEYLISHPAECIKKICSYLELEYSEEMLDHTKAAKKLVQKDEENWKKETFKPIDQSNFSNWIERLSPLEALCSYYNDRQFMKQHNYDTYVPNATFKQRVLAMAIVSTCIPLAILYKARRRFNFWKMRARHGTK